MSRKYICERGHEYTEEEYVKIGGICPQDGTMISPMEESIEGQGTISCNEIECGNEGNFGVGIFVFDFSWSMGEEIPSGEGTKTNLRKIDVVANAFGNMIAELLHGKEPLSQPDKLYLSLIGFSTNAWHVGTYKLDKMRGDNYEDTFIKWKDFILSEWNKVKSYTNITAALKMARDIYDAICSNEIKGKYGFEGDFDGLKYQDTLIGGSILRVPNIRFFVYSDGMHTVSEPFVNHLRDVKILECGGKPINGVMSLYIGDPNRSDEDKLGDKQMEEIAGICPIHGVKGKITLSKLTESGYNALRNILHVTSNATGFCHQCV